MGSPTIFSGRRTRLLTPDGLIRPDGTKIDFDGSINYIANGHAAQSTQGWATYADAAGVQPVDGTGGTANITFTRSTTTPLRGIASFELAKDAVNRQGQGASYDFTIDPADVAKRLTISFDYEIASGTYADGDIGVYIVDVTNAQVIQPAGFSVQNVGIDSRLTATFQTASNSTNYRLCLHVASTSASAYTLRIDNVQVGPVNATFSTPVTDWVSYAPTGAWTTNTTYTGRWRRVGDSMEVQARVTVAGGAPGSGNLTVTLPSGYSIDTAKILGTVQYSVAMGTGQIIDSGSGAHVIQPSYNNATSVGLLYQSALSGGQSVVTPTAPITFASGDTVEVTFRVPIVGWSSSAQVVSDSSEGRVVAGYVNRTGSNFAMSAGGATFRYYTAVMNNTVVDTVGGATLSGSDTAYTVRTPGVYDVEFSARIEAGATAVVNQLILELNGSAVSNAAALTGTVLASSILSTVDADGRAAIARIRRRFNAGDVIRPQILRYSNTSQNMVVEASWFSVALIQGSQTLLGGETVAFRANKTTGSHTSTGAWQDVASWDAGFDDSTGSFNATTGVYTVPSPGRYLVAGTLIFSANATGVRSVKFLRNNADTGLGAATPGSSANVTAVSHTIILRCLAGDTIKMQGLQDSGGTRAYGTTDGGSSFSITRVGNY